MCFVVLFLDRCAVFKTFCRFVQGILPDSLSWLLQVQALNGDFLQNPNPKHCFFERESSFAQHRVRRSPRNETSSTECVVLTLFFDTSGVSPH